MNLADINQKLKGINKRLQSGMTLTDAEKEYIGQKLKRIKYSLYLEAGNFAEFFRDLTDAESKVQFASFKSFMNSHEKVVQKILDDITGQQKVKFLRQMKRAIESGDITKINTITMGFNSQLQEQLKQEMLKAVEFGRDKSANELGIKPPPISNETRNVLSTQSAMLINNRANSIEDEVRRTALDGVMSGAGAAAIAFALSNAYDIKSKNQNQQIVGQITSSGINVGRNSVFRDNQKVIHGLQRSEVLDSVTCPVCLSIDGRVLAPNDPFAQLGQVHTHCRGLWVPILLTSSDLPRTKPLPKSLQNRFQRVEGIPAINKFKQLKAPVINKTSRVQSKIDDGQLKNNPNINGK